MNAHIIRIISGTLFALAVGFLIWRRSNKEEV
jgi:hypothetical protein